MSRHCRSTRSRWAACSTASCRSVRPTSFAKPPSAPSNPLPTCAGARIEKGFRRLVHPNGICLTGLWQITQDTGYSGYFRNGSRALVVGRYSTCCRETRRGHVRSLSLVGKLFPTADPDHVAPLRTASFITQEDIGGDYNDYINDVELLNAPNTTALRRGPGMPVLAVFGVMLSLVDRRPTIRQLYQVAELGTAQGEPTRAADLHAPHAGAGPARIEGAELDFRDEIMAQIYDRGDERPKRALTFDIAVTDDGETRKAPVPRAA